MVIQIICLVYSFYNIIYLEFSAGFALFYKAITASLFALYLLHLGIYNCLLSSNCIILRLISLTFPLCVMLHNDKKIVRSMTQSEKKMVHIKGPMFVF